VAAVQAAIGPVAGIVVVRDGRLVRSTLDDALVTSRVRLGGVDDVDDAGAIVGAVAEPVDVFGTMNDAGATAPIVLDVPAGVTIDRPIVVVDWLDTDGLATFPRLSVRIGADSEVTLVEWRGSRATVDAFAAPITELDVGRAARFRHVVVQDRGERVFE